MCGVCVCACMRACMRGTGSALASYLPQLAGGCVALGTSTSSGAGVTTRGVSQARPVATSGPLSICPSICVCVRGGVHLVNTPYIVIPFIPHLLL